MGNQKHKSLPGLVAILGLYSLFASIQLLRNQPTLVQVRNQPTLVQSRSVSWEAASTWKAASTCPCIPEYLAKLKGLGIKNNVTYEEWESMLCRPPPKHTSLRPLIIGVGPGTTATRSFALAVNLLHFSVLHYGAVRGRKGNAMWNTDIKGETNLPRFRVDELGKGTKFREDWDHTADIDFVALYNSMDAIFDWPIQLYAVDILRAYPNAKIIMTHRDPVTYAQKRLHFCKMKPKPRECGVPFVLRPLDMYMREMTDDQNVGSFEATEHVLKCLVPAHRYLQVDAWDPPPEGWMPRIADFLNVTMPPPESNCSIPKKAGHSLECGDDPACHQCRRYTNSHPGLFPEPY
jgi:hypothetical protein